MLCTFAFFAFVSLQCYIIIIVVVAAAVVVVVVVVVVVHEMD